MTNEQMTTEEIKAADGTYSRQNGDTQVWLASHQPSGSSYALRAVSVWKDNECIGATIADAIDLDAQDMYEPVPVGGYTSAYGSVFPPDDGRWTGALNALDGGEGSDNADWAREQAWQWELELNVPAILQNAPVA